jgi:hypothetical protein
MSSEREKLIEIWLDNAGERQYQFAFRNALLSAGYTIIHNTSHTALELGKDIIALAPGKRLMAYQLKGNPGGRRLTISQWQELITQINTLVYQPIAHPAVKAGTPHTPVLVTNGEIHEDVLAAIKGYNSGLQRTRPQVKPLETIARGQLLQMILKSADTLWPVEVSIQKNMLNVFAAAGNDELPMDEYIEILNDILKGNYSEVAIPSVHLVTSVLASNWIKQRNHFELIKMHALVAVAAICYQARWKKQRSKDQRFIEEMIFDIRSHLRSFVEELAQSHNGRPLINDSVFAEFSYYHVRKKIVSGLLSVALLDQDFKLDGATHDCLWEFVCKTKHEQFLLWEGIIPYCLAEFWALSNIQGTVEPDRRLLTLLNDILNLNSTNDGEHSQLPGPYYTLGDIVEWKYRFFLQNFRSPLDRDSHYRRSWFAEALFYLMVRRNYKSRCSLFWPDLTRFTHVRTRLPNENQFGPAKCEDAIAEDKIIDVSKPKSWGDVVKEARNDWTPPLPRQLLERPVLTLLYCLFMPQRMSIDVILWLDRVLSKSWH